MLTVDDIRARYPHPCVAPILAPKVGPLPVGTYCVGGACVLMAGSSRQWQSAFPHEARLADALQQLKPGLRHGEALYAAYEIIAANDAGHFDDAWDMVADALADNGAISKRYENDNGMVS